MKYVTDILREIRRGKLNELASAKLQEVVLAAKETGKKGQLVITIDVIPDDTDGDGRMQVAAKYTAKVPQPEVGDSVFFATDDGDLIRTDPRQGDMLTDASDGEIRGAVSVAQ